MPTRLLTETWRDFLCGEHDDWTDPRKQSESSKIRKRLAYGLADIALAGDNLHRLGETERILMDHRNGQNPRKDPTRGRITWREQPPRDLIPSILALLIQLASDFHYGPADWENWIKEAFETVNPGGFAKVEIYGSPYVPYTRARDYYNGESLTVGEMYALYHAGLIPNEDLPREFPPLTTAFYEKPERVGERSG